MADDEKNIDNVNNVEKLIPNKIAKKSESRLAAVKAMYNYIMSKGEIEPGRVCIDIIQYYNEQEEGEGNKELNRDLDDG